MPRVRILQRTVPLCASHHPQTGRLADHHAHGPPAQSCQLMVDKRAHPAAPDFFVDRVHNGDVD